MVAEAKGQALSPDSLFRLPLLTEATSVALRVQTEISDSVQAQILSQPGEAGPVILPDRQMREGKPRKGGAVHKEEPQPRAACHPLTLAGSGPRPPRASVSLVPSTPAVRGQ